MTIFIARPGGSRSDPLCYLGPLSFCRHFCPVRLFRKIYSFNHILLDLDRVPIWPRSPQSFRNSFAHHLKKFDLTARGFRPYSLRRGCATALFQQIGSMEQALLKGRWSSTKVARNYVADGLPFLPGLRLSTKAKEMLTTWSPDSQLSGP